MSAREPILNVPGVIVGLIVAMGLVQLLRAAVLDDASDIRLVFDYGFIPARPLFAASEVLADETLAAIARSGSRSQLALAQWLRAEPGWGLATFVSHAFLHADWTHFGFNAVWLLAFGTPVARRVGALRFLLLFGVGAAAGALAHLAVRGADVAPLIGASGAVSAAMGAATRFVFAPGRGGLFTFDGVPTARIAPLADLARNRRAVLFIAIWTATNLLFGVASEAFDGLFGLSSGTIAWQAHLGGFVAGLIVLPFLDPSRHDDALDEPSTA